MFIIQAHHFQTIEDKRLKLWYYYLITVTQVKETKERWSVVCSTAWHVQRDGDARPWRGRSRESDKALLLDSMGAAQDVTDILVSFHRVWATTFVRG